MNDLQDDKKERLNMNPKIRELQRKKDTSISQKKRMMTLSLLEELRVEQDKEEKQILIKIKQEKSYDTNTKKRTTIKRDCFKESKK